MGLLSQTGERSITTTKQYNISRQKKDLQFLKEKIAENELSSTCDSTISGIRKLAFTNDLSAITKLDVANASMREIRRFKLLLNSFKKNYSNSIDDTTLMSFVRSRMIDDTIDRLLSWEFLGNTLSDLTQLDEFINSQRNFFFASQDAKTKLMKVNNFDLKLVG